MNLKYDNTMEDLISFYHYHFGASNILRAQILKSNLWLSGGIFLGFSYLSYVQNNSVLVFTGSLVSTVVFFLYPSFVKWWQLREIRQQSNTEFMESFLCQHELKISKEGLIEKNQFKETKTSWEIITNIVSTPKHFFIYLSEFQAHVVPKRSITNGDLEKFMNCLKESANL